MKINRAWLNDLMNLLEEGLIAMELKSIRIDELEAALRGIAGICLDKDHEAAVIAIAAVVREALAAEPQ
jgi:hypothetical protein